MVGLYYRGGIGQCADFQWSPLVQWVRAGTYRLGPGATNRLEGWVHGFTLSDICSGAARLRPADPDVDPPRHSHSTGRLRAAR